MPSIPPKTARGIQAFTEQLESGEVNNYRFSTKEMKQPIQDTVTRCGWTYRGSRVREALNVKEWVRHLGPAES